MKLRGVTFPIVILTWTTINGFILNKLHSASSIEGASINENIDGNTRVAGIPTAIPQNSITFVGNSDYDTLLDLKKTEVGKVKGVIATKLSALSTLKDKKLAFIRTLLAAKLTPIINLIRSKQSLIQPLISGQHQLHGQASSGLSLFHRPLNLFTGALSAIPALSSWKPKRVSRKYILIPAHVEFGHAPISFGHVKYQHALFDALVAAKKQALSSGFPESRPQVVGSIAIGESGETGDIGEAVTEPDLEPVEEPCTDQPTDSYDDYVEDEEVGSLPLFNSEPFVPHSEVEFANMILPADNYLPQTFPPVSTDPTDVVQPAPVYEYERPVPSGSSFTSLLPPEPTLSPVNYAPPLQFPMRSVETSYGVPIKAQSSFGDRI